MAAWWPNVMRVLTYDWLRYRRFLHWLNFGTNNKYPPEGALGQSSLSVIQILNRHFAYGQQTKLCNNSDLE